MNKRNIESIKELRKICQDSREDMTYKICWTARTFVRSTSIYFTKLFLKLGISANQITLIYLLIGIGTGILLIHADVRYWFIGSILIYLSAVFDCVDGEVARYNKSSSSFGQFLDDISYYSTWAYILACMSFGIYNMLQWIPIYIFGFLAVISFLSIYFVPTLLVKPIKLQDGYYLAFKKTVTDESVSTQKLRLIFFAGHFLFGMTSLYIPLLIACMVDYFIPSITIGAFAVNARGLYFIAYALAAFAEALIVVYSTFKQGIQDTKKREEDGSR